VNHLLTLSDDDCTRMARALTCVEWIRSLQLDTRSKGQMTAEVDLVDLHIPNVRDELQWCRRLLERLAQLNYLSSAPAQPGEDS
jgi:hypothetical protein